MLPKRPHRPTLGAPLEMLPQCPWSSQLSLPHSNQIPTDSRRTCSKSSQKPQTALREIVLNPLGTKITQRLSARPRRRRVWCSGVAVRGCWGQERNGDAARRPLAGSRGFIFRRKQLIRMEDGPRSGFSPTLPRSSPWCRSPKHLCPGPGDNWTECPYKVCHVVNQPHPLSRSLAHEACSRDHPARVN